MSISRRILLARLGLALPAAAFLSATSARAATEDASTAGAPADAPAHHSKKKHTASHAHKRKSAGKTDQAG